MKKAVAVAANRFTFNGFHMPVVKSNNPLPMGKSACWSCAENQRLESLFCPSCHAVQPPTAKNYFELLGIVQDFTVDLGQLEKNYIELQKKLHPDRYANKTGQEKLLAQSQAVDINEAYHTLKDPMLRASYLLRLNGIEYDVQKERTIHDAELLTEMMDRREQVSEITDSDGFDAVLAELSGEMDSQYRLIADFIKTANWNGVKELLLRQQYLQKLQKDIRERQAQLLGSGL